MKERIGLLLVGMIAIAAMLLHATGIVPVRLLNELELKTYDYRLRMSMPGGVDPRIVIIDVDENSLSKLGAWPWPRDLIAQMTDNLFAHYGVEVVGFDVVFPEQDRDLALDDLRKLADAGTLSDEVMALVNAPDRDQQFADVLARHNVVLGYGFDSNTTSVSVGMLPQPVLEDLPVEHTGAPRARRHTANLPELQSVAHGGFFSLLDNVDSDGIIRRVSLLNQYKGGLYESFSLAIARNYLGMDIDPVVESHGEKNQLEALDLGFYQVAVDGQAAVHVPYQGPQGSFRYVSAEDVIRLKVPNPDDLAGTIALVGTSAAGLIDLRATPVQNVYPGVEVHANVIAGLLDGSFRDQPSWTRAVEFLMLIVAGLVLTLLLPFLSAMWMTLLALGVGTAVAGLNYYMWTSASFILPLANTVILVFFIYVFNMIFGFFSEARSRQELRSAFGLYVPPEIVDEMKGKSGEEMLVSEKKEMTVLFTDIRDFTPIAEAMDAEELADYINAFLTPLTGIVHHHRGAIDKYMGDAMMAFWGAPLDDPEHALHGVQAAIAIRDEIHTLNQQFEQKGWPRIRIGVGLGTGMVSVGNMGSEFRMAYTVLGDAVNLGSRLEGLTKFYGVEAIVGESTVAAVSGYIFRELDYVRVKGKQQPIRIFEPLCSEDTIQAGTLEELQSLEIALASFRSQHWEDAVTMFTELSEATEHPLYELYLERVAHYRKHPPGDDWDGVFTYEVK